MAGEYQKDVTFDEVEVGDLILVELFDGNTYLGDRRGIAREEKEGIWYFNGMSPVYKEALGYRMFKVTVLDGEDQKHLDWLRDATDVEKVLVRAEYSESTDALVLAAEIRRLRKIEANLIRLADAYEANTVMLAGIADAPDSLLGIMAECSFSTAKMIRKALDE